MRLQIQHLFVLTLGFTAARELAHDPISEVGGHDVSSNLAHRRAEEPLGPAIALPDNFKREPRKKASSKPTKPSATSKTKISTQAKTTAPQNTSASATRTTSAKGSTQAQQSTKSSHSLQTSSRITHAASVTSKSVKSSPTGNSASSTAKSASKTEATSTAGASSTPSANSNAKSRSFCTAPDASSAKSQKAVPRSYPPTLDRRVWIDPGTDFAALQNLGNNKIDMSDGFSSGFIPFEDKQKAGFMNNFQGCTGVVVFSDKGMQMLHLWEMPPSDKNGQITNPNLGKTLYPGNNQRFVDQAMTWAGGELGGNKDKFAGGQLVLMIPKTGNDYTYAVDDTPKWTNINVKTNKPFGSSSKYGGQFAGKTDGKDGKDEWSVTEKAGQGVVEKIKKMVQDATGLSDSSIHECNYQVPLDTDGPMHKFVVEYDPDGGSEAGKGKKGVQVWCDNDKQFKNAAGWWPSESSGSS